MVLPVMPIKADLGQHRSNVCLLISGPCLQSKEPGRHHYMVQLKGVTVSISDQPGAGTTPHDAYHALLQMCKSHKPSAGGSQVFQ